MKQPTPLQPKSDVNFFTVGCAFGLIACGYIVHFHPEYISKITKDNSYFPLVVNGLFIGSLIAIIYSCGKIAQSVRIRNVNIKTKLVDIKIGEKEEEGKKDE